MGLDPEVVANDPLSGRVPSSRPVNQVLRVVVRTVSGQTFVDHDKTTQGREIRTCVSTADGLATQRDALLSSLKVIW